MSGCAGSSNQARERSLRERSEPISAALSGEAVGDDIAVFAARIEPRRGEARLVRRVRKHLRLEAHSIALPVGVPALADHPPSQEVAGVELQPGRRREEVEHTPGARVFEPRDGPQRAGGAVEHEVVIVAVRENDLLVSAVANVKADWRWVAEIEGRARHGAQLAGRNEPGIDWHVAARMNRQPRIEDRSAGLRRKIEIAVVRDVDDRRLVGLRAVFDTQLVLVEREAGAHAQRAGIALVPVWAHVREHRGRGGAALHRTEPPDTLLKP